MAWETWVQSQVESYQRLKKWYLMPPCSTLSIIRYGSRVKWSNPGKGVAPSPTPWCSKQSKRERSGHPRLWSPTLLLLWTPTHGHINVGQAAKTYIHQLCMDTGCHQENRLRSMAKRMDSERESRESMQTNHHHYYDNCVYIIIHNY